MAIKVGVTGGIGSGKSLVCRLLQGMGVPVYICDVETKRLMLTDPMIREDLISLLGEGVYINGKLNKPLLANYLFANAENASRINAIVHPRVKQDYWRWVSEHTADGLLAMESAILVEAGFTDCVDSVVMVDAPLNVRIERAMRRDGASREQIESRIKSQMADEEKRKCSRHIINNDGIEPLIPQILELKSVLFG